MKTRATKVLQNLMIQKYPIKIEELAQKFEVSDRTIRTDLKEINAYLSKKNLPLTQIIRSEGVKIYLTKQQKEKLNKYIDKLIIDYYSNSELRVLNLIMEFAFGDMVYMHKKQREFEVSKSTIDNDMRIVRNILNEYHLSVNTQPFRKNEIKGSEQAVRVMLFNIINKLMGPVDVYDSVKMKSPTYRVLFNFLSLKSFENMSRLYERHIKYDDVLYKNQTVLFLLIWITRIKSGKALLGKIRKEVVAKDDIDLIISELEKSYDVNINDSERGYISSILETFISSSIKNPSVWTRGQLITLELITHVQRKLNLHFSNQEELFSGLFKHITKLISRLQNNMQIRNPLTKEIKKNNPEVFETIQSFKFEIDNEKAVTITEDEIAFIAIYFLMSVNQTRQNYDYLYKAVVFCNHGKATGRLLAQMLEENYEVDVVAILSSDELSLLNRVDADTAFSTVPLELNNFPLLIVDSLLINENDKKFENFLNQYAHLKQSVRNDSHSSNKQSNGAFFEEVLTLIKKRGGKVNEPVYKELKSIFESNRLLLNDEVALPKLSDVLEDTNILLDLEANDWIDSIKLTAQPLLATNVITENYIHAMIDAVKRNGPYIIIAPHLALAHAQPEDGVKQIGLSVSRLKTPVEFGHAEDDPIKIIFSIAPMDSYTHLNIMKDIFELINNEDKLKKLINCTSHEEFKEILLNN